MTYKIITRVLAWHYLYEIMCNNFFEVSKLQQFEDNLIS